VSWTWWDWPWLGRRTIVLQCYDTLGWVIWPVKSSPKWPIMCWVGRYTLLYHTMPCCYILRSSDSQQGVLFDCLSLFVSALINLRENGCSHCRDTFVRSPTAFHETQQNVWYPQGNESTTCWERSGKHCSQINSEIQIQIPDHFWSSWPKFKGQMHSTLAQVCSLWVLSSLNVLRVVV